VAGGGRYPLGFQPVQKLRPGEQRLLLVHVEGHVQGEFCRLGRVGDNVAQNECLLPAWGDEMLAWPGKCPSVGIAAEPLPFCARSFGATSPPTSSLRPAVRLVHSDIVNMYTVTLLTIYGNSKLGMENC
jgi:hypothetical protein